MSPENCSLSRLSLCLPVDVPPPHHNDLQLLLKVIICLYFGKTMSILQIEKPVFLAVNSRRSQPEACMSNLKLGPCASVDDTVHRELYV